MARAHTTLAAMVAPCAPHYQGTDRGREQRAQRGQRIAGQPQQHDGPPAEAVGHRAPGELGDAEGQDGGRQGELHRRHGGVQVGRQRGQRGQHQVGGDRLQAEQQRQHQGRHLRRQPDRHQKRSSGRR
jgi:hypothetical protein